ncbi:uncharacterized protein LOC128471485 [Spea bombifrons]|uniref:uncharacterized protein LOC128471485 n=1 Tax=Spea bombifrons TaxID=233779 RepID=UPI00234B2E05|nr:uncharacterized protein LOC128471485 [Spea bombifrons]
MVPVHLEDSHFVLYIPELPVSKLVDAELCERSLQEDPSSSIATVTSDEVFMISDGSNKENFSFPSYPKGRILKRSVTSPASVSDWLNADYTSVDLSVDDKEAESLEVDSARQRTWSIRTFNSLLPPIPQLQVKWSSRISAGSFTKLVDSGCTVPPTISSPHIPRRAGSAIQIEGSTSRLFSESSDSNASYPLTNSAQLNRKLPSCNLKRTRPYFGFLNGTSDALRSSNTKTTCSKEKHLCQHSGTEFTGCFKSPMTNGVHTKELSMDVEKPKTVFVICEEADDQQPLVFDDHLSPSEEVLSGSFEGRCEDDAAMDSCDFSTHVKVPEDYTYPCTRITSSFNSQSTTINSRHKSAPDTHSPFNQMGLATD